jgi:hypothetical protein
MKFFKSLLLTGMVLTSTFSYSQNPIIRDQFSADPTSRVFRVRTGSAWKITTSFLPQT